MILKIEKRPLEGMRVELSPDSSKKPMVINLDNDKLKALIGILQAAQGSQTFVFHLEL